MDTHLFQKRNNWPNKFLFFRLEKVYLLNDVPVGECNNPRFQYSRQIVYKILVVNFEEGLLMVVFDELLYSGFETVG